MNMTHDITSLEGTLGTFLANTEYGIWRYCRNHTRRLPFESVLLPERLDGDFIFDRRKEQLQRKIEDLSYLGLVNSHLFPHYDEYESTIFKYLESISDTLFATDYIMIPKSRAYPEGGQYKLVNLILPEDLFSNIPDRFFDRFDCRMQIILTKQYPDMFWQNLDLKFDRKGALCSWNGKRFGKISSDMTIVVRGASGEFKGTVIPSLMSVLLRAWTEACLLRDFPSYRWAGTSLGRGRYRRNIDVLMADSDNECLNSMGKYLRNIQDISGIVSNAERISETSKEPDCSGMPPISAVEYAKGILKRSIGYERLNEMEKMLDRIIGSLDDQDPKELCEIWNRCVKQKARTIEDIRALLISKYISVRNDILAILSMRPVFHHSHGIYDTTYQI